MGNRHRLVALVAATVVASFTAAALAVSAQPLAWGYPALEGLCLLQAAAAIDGVEAAYPIGTTVSTNHGSWRCTKVVVRQSPLATGGVWVPQ